MPSFETASLFIKLPGYSLEQLDRMGAISLPSQNNATSAAG
jgi:hypothetical protein